MERPDGTDPSSQALSEGNWALSKELFEAELAEGDDPAARLGLARALWWLHDVDGALANAERAYVAFRDTGRVRRAASVALWLSREHASATGNLPASAGWFARAQGLLADEETCAEIGWLALVEAERTAEPEGMRASARIAIEIARVVDDPDLEAEAMARLGYAEISLGRIAAGADAIDEAMTAATGGEARRLETIGSVTCTSIAALEIAADWPRIERWGQVVESWIVEHEDVAVLGFCNACCAELFVSTGQWEQADGMLRDGLAALQASGQRARCVHPAAKLAELRLMQGRVEEAEQLLAGYEHLPEAVHALASLHLAKGEPTVAAAILHRRLNRLGDRSMIAAPLLALLVDAQLTAGDPDGAATTAERLGELAETGEIPRLLAIADAAAGAVGAARGDPHTSRYLESALARFAEEGMRLEAARARIALARCEAAESPEVAIDDARIALSDLERIGAVREADAAAAFLRAMGSHGRTGPKDLGTLTRRETEVLGLLGEGLSNAEIAARLYISTKTAGHHVSSILSKLHLTRRSEATGYALRHMDALAEPIRDQG